MLFDIVNFARRLGRGLRRHSHDLVVNRGISGLMKARYIEVNGFRPGSHCKAGVWCVGRAWAQGAGCADSAKRRPAKPEGGSVGVGKAD